MQVTPYQPVRVPAASGRVSADGPQGLVPGLERARPAALADAGNSGTPTTESPQAPRPGLRAWEPGRQQTITSARQALDYLEQLSGQLLRLRKDVAARLSKLRAAAQPQGGNTLPVVGNEPWLESLDAVERVWQQRPELARQTIDGQLRYAGASGSMQAFRVRGLDAQALQGGGREVLTFALQGWAAGVSSVTLEPEEGLAANIRRLDLALGASGVRAMPDGRGDVIFKVNESLWPRVRDGLSVKGEGQRYAAGALHRVRAEPEPDAVSPAQWRRAADDTQSLERVLQAVLRAIDRVKHAQRQVSQALAEASAGAATEADPAQAAFAKSFEALGSAPGFGAYVQVAPALVGISRERVLALLSGA